MQKEILLKTKIGYNLAKVGLLSKLYAIQTLSSKSCSVTPEQFSVLAVLINNDGIYQRQISAITLKDRANITRILNILEKLECITKKTDANGRQIFKIYITEKGKAIYEETLPEILKVWEDSSVGINEQDLIKCSEVLAKITENLKDKVNIQI